MCLTLTECMSVDSGSWKCEYEEQEYAFVCVESRSRLQNPFVLLIKY